jgi:deaminated glutathione amidase
MGDQHTFSLVVEGYVMGPHPVALVQMKSLGTKRENLRISQDYIREAAQKRVQLICFPEFQMGYESGESSFHLELAAEPVNGGKFALELRSAAKKNNIHVLATIYERGDTKNTSRVYDTAILIDNKGAIISLYRKVHLYDALGVKESLKFIAGNNIPKPNPTPVGIIGMMICYDIRFPEMSRILAVQGAEILVTPSAWFQGIMKEDHWTTLVKARSIENGLYIVAPNQVGNTFSGRSMVVDPFGIPLLDMGDREGMEIVEIDLSRVHKVRKSLPLLKNRRTDLYGKHIGAFTRAHKRVN